MHYFVENLWRPLEHLGEHPSHLQRPEQFNTVMSAFLSKVFC